MYVDAVYCYRPSSMVCRSVGQSVTLVSPAKMAEPIKMPFGLRTWVGPGHHVLDGVQIPTMGRGNFEGERGDSLYSIGHSVVICAKTAEPIEMPFGMGPRNHVLDGGSRCLHGKGQFWGKGRPL